MSRTVPAFGCGEVFGQPIPEDLCGGAVKFAATFSTPLGELPGTITVFCVVGPKAPASIEHAFTEGVTVDVPGIINFNHPGGGDNIYVQLTWRQRLRTSLAWSSWSYLDSKPGRPS